MPGSPQQATGKADPGSPVQQQRIGGGGEEGGLNAGQLLASSSPESRDVSGSSTVMQPEASSTYQRQ